MKLAEQILNKLGEIENKADALNDEVAQVSSTKKLGILTGVPGAPARAPRARQGEDIMTSRGFHYGKALGVLGGKLRPDEAKVEMDYCHRFTDICVKQGYRPHNANSVLVPFWPEAFSEDSLSQSEYFEMKSLLAAGVSRADPDEAQYYTNRFSTKAAIAPAQSWIDQSAGGSFVGPATFGAPIELLRNTEVFMKAGATVIPLGPSGRMTFPRLTGATTANWSAENVQNTPTTAQTGQLELSAKKVIGTVVLPNELLRFGSPATEAIIRNDLMKSASLVLDKGLLDGPGSNNQPLGLATMGAAGQLATVTPAASNQLSPQDAYNFQAVVESNNATPNCYVMHPTLKWGWYEARWTPYSGGGQLGGFMFDMVRGPDGSMDSYLGGLKIVSSTQISKTRGSGSQTYMLCFDASDYYLGLFGAIEFASSDSGYQLLSQDATAVRAILTGDGAPRHPGAVGFADALNLTVIN